MAVMEGATYGARGRTVHTLGGMQLKVDRWRSPEGPPRLRDFLFQDRREAASLICAARPSCGEAGCRNGDSRKPCGHRSAQAAKRISLVFRPRSLHRRKLRK